MGTAAELGDSTVLLLALLIAAGAAGVAIKYGIVLARNGYSRFSKSIFIASVTVCVLALWFAFLVYAIINGSG